MQLTLVDDHPLFREALRGIIQLGVPGARIDEAESIEAARAVLSARPGADLITLDLSMKGVSGFDGMISLKISFPRIPILIVSAFEESRIVREAMQLGAAGFVPKSASKSTYLIAIERIMAGSIFVPEIVEPLSGHPGAGTERAASSMRVSTLTPAQMKVLQMIKTGKINKQIAHELGIGDSMVKAHVSEIMRKLGVSNRTQVALCASSLDFDRIGL